MKELTLTYLWGWHSGSVISACPPHVCVGLLQFPPTIKTRVRSMLLPLPSTKTLGCRPGVGPWALQSLPTAEDELQRTKCRMWINKMSN